MPEFNESEGPRRVRAVVLAMGPYSAHGPLRLEDLAIFLRDGDDVDRLNFDEFGVDGSLVSNLSERLCVSLDRLLEIVAIPHAARISFDVNVRLRGQPAVTSLAIAELLGRAMAIVESSTAARAETFDTAKWLGRWIERPQPSLGGKRPSDILPLPTGRTTLLRLLGAIESGVYL